MIAKKLFILAVLQVVVCGEDDGTNAWNSVNSLYQARDQFPVTVTVRTSKTLQFVYGGLFLKAKGHLQNLHVFFLPVCNTIIQTV